MRNLQNILFLHEFLQENTESRFIERLKFIMFIYINNCYNAEIHRTLCTLHTIFQIIYNMMLYNHDTIMIHIFIFFIQKCLIYKKLILCCLIRIKREFFLQNQNFATSLLRYLLLYPFFATR